MEEYMKFSFYKDKGKWQRSVFLVFFILSICFLAFEFIIPICRAEERDQEEPIDFTSYNLEELKQVMIISVLKKPQKLSEATSAITVITQEDIRKSGATSIPELLRGVPGFQVAQIDSSTWAVSARGFNHRYANKLLVLMDGRNLYTPSFSGVHWNVQDTLFEDIERIEVIRGPGAALWGANAVNGVINIVTKKAEDTQGWLVTSGLGNEEKRFGALRHGIKLKENAYGRIYLKYFEKDDFVESSKCKQDDLWKPPDDEKDGFERPSIIKEKEGWDSFRGGGRIDWYFSNDDSLTLEGDIYDGKNMEKILLLDQNSSLLRKYDFDNNFSGGNVILRWIHPFSKTSDMALQFYYDRTKQARKPFDKERFDTFDLDFQHNFILGKRQEIIWGLGYRLISDHIDTVPNKLYSNKTNLISTFFQDEIQIVKDRLRLTVGSKFEHNDYTGFEVQPSVRMLWKPSDIQNVWISLSRAVRTPSRGEYDPETFMGAPPPGPPPPEYPPSDSSFHEHPPGWTTPGADQAENLIAYELGYRIQMTRSFFLDLASYFNKYEDLIIMYDITAEAETYGIEAAINWDILEWWRIWASYTYLHMFIKSIDMPSFFDPNLPPPPPFDIFWDKSSPKHQIVIHSSMDLYRHLELDLELRYVDNLDIYVVSYTEMDARLGWKPKKNLELSIVGRNLLHDHHPEFLSLGPWRFSAGEDSEVERGVYGKITCRF
jgi:iron complex outermembrane receptor protein